MTRAISNLLRADEAIRHLHSRANSYLCEHRLAKVAHDIERDHGEVLFDREKFDDRITYKFHAARPVSLRVHGKRNVPISAWAAWGASATLSFVRHDAYQPFRHLGSNLMGAIITVLSAPGEYYEGTVLAAMWGLILEVTTRLFTRSHRALTMLVGRVPLINNLGPGGLAVKTGLTVYSAAVLLGVAEMLLGAPHRCRQDVHPPLDPQRVALFDALREHGVLYGVRCAVEKLDPPQLNGFLKKTSFCLAAVLGATLLVADLGAAMAQLGVLTGVATVAAGGALIGVALCLFAYFRDPWDLGKTVPLRHVQFDQNHMAYDRHLYLGVPVNAR